MSDIRLPVLVGLIVASVMSTIFLVWIVSGGRLDERRLTSEQFFALTEQRDELERELENLAGDDMCSLAESSDLDSSAMLPPLRLDVDLDASVVWIIAGGDSGVSTGSGFFVSDSQVVTNYHVVEAVEANAEILVAARGYGFALGRLSHFGDSAIGARDLAVITLLEPIEWAVPLAVSGDTANVDLRLMDVIAAGFPGAVIESYGSLDNMVTGDVLDLPQLVLTSGVISSSSLNELGTQIIAHTAQISQGNSGGALIDQCGTVLGVNTFIRSDSGGVRSFSIGPESLRSFLSSVAIPYIVATQRCE